MTRKMMMAAVGVAGVIGLGTAAMALAQGPNPHGPMGAAGCPMMGQGMGLGMTGPGMTGMGPGSMGPGTMGYGMGPGMMGPGMMGMAPGMMGPATTGYGMVGPGMTGQVMGPGMMGPGMMSMGPGMMGTDPGMTGPGMMQALRSDLSVEDVRHVMEHQLGWTGNPNIKLGTLTEKDGDAIIVEIVTQDGALVQRLEVNRHTGWMQPVQ